MPLHSVFQLGTNTIETRQVGAGMSSMKSSDIQEMVIHVLRPHRLHHRALPCPKPHHYLKRRVQQKMRKHRHSQDLPA